MGGILYTTQQVADLLGLHVKTVRGYVRDGRLKSTLIGKQYRISRSDLEAFTGAAVTSGEARLRPVSEASSIVQIDGIREDESARLSNLLMTAAKGHRESVPLRVETLFDPERNRLKVIVIGSVDATATVLQLVDKLTDSR